MNIKKFSMMLLSAVAFAALLNGCGSSSKEGGTSPADVPKVSESTCAQCHGSARSSVTAAFLYDEYKNSKHFTAGTAGCQDCHGGGAQHNGVGPMPYPNPDTSRICSTCHTDASLGSPHFSAFTSAKKPQYVITQDTQRCVACHNPHDTTTALNAVNKDFAGSGHGDIAGAGFVGRNWTSSSPCVRCHTSTGYVTYVTTGSITTFTGRNEVLGCKTCHNNYSWSRRTVAAVNDPKFTNVTSIHFPDAGESNICLTCHVGREAGQSIKNSTAFKNLTGSTSFVNSHYLTAGGVVFAQTGYEFDGRSYTNTSAHPGIGGTTDGPCVGCHMKTNTSHHFLPVTKDAGGTITAVISTTCAACHGGGPTPVGLEAEKKGLNAANEALKATLKLLNIHFGPNYPYFFTSATTQTSATAVKKWAKFTPVGAMTARNTMGAAFNLNMVLHDPGAFAHNKVYVKRLLYDSIDWANDGILDNDVEATINASTLTAQQKTDAIAYILGAPGGARP